MATLADELLNDFEESGSEGEAGETNDGLQQDSAETGVDGTPKDGADGMELDGDEAGAADKGNGLNSAEDSKDKQEEGGEGEGEGEEEEDSQAKIERMQLGGVTDVRSVARLMKTLQPILEVS